MSCVNITKNEFNKMTINIYFGLINIYLIMLKYYNLARRANFVNKNFLDVR